MFRDIQTESEKFVSYKKLVFLKALYKLLVSNSSALLNS